MLAKCAFPGGIFHAYVPWASSLSNEQQEAFIHGMRQRTKLPTCFNCLAGKLPSLAINSWCTEILR